MSDLLLNWTADGYADLALIGADLVVDDSLRSQVITSLFTDRRAPAEFRPDLLDRRGCWSDALLDDDADGCLLWTLIDRAKITESRAQDASAAAQIALQWLITDGIASAVTVTASVVADSELWFDVSITLSSGGLERYRLQIVGSTPENPGQNPLEIRGTGGPAPIIAEPWSAPEVGQSAEIRGTGGPSPIAAAPWSAPDAGFVGPIGCGQAGGRPIDPPPPPPDPAVIQFSSPTYSVDFSADPAVAQFALVRSGSTADAITVTVTPSSTDYIAGTDYDATPIVVIIPAGSSGPVSAQLTTLWTPNTPVAAGTLTLSITALSSGSAGAQDTAIVTAQNSVEIGPILQFSADQYFATAEESGYRCIITLERSGDMSGYAACDVSFASTDFEPDVDFSVGPQSVGTGPGSDTVVVELSINIDPALGQPLDGTITATLIDTGYASIGARGTATVVVYAEGVAPAPDYYLVDAGSGSPASVAGMQAVAMPGNTIDVIESLPEWAPATVVLHAAEGSDLLVLTDGYSNWAAWSTASLIPSPRLPNPTPPLTAYSLRGMLIKDGQLISINSNGDVLRINTSTWAEITPRPARCGADGGAIDINPAGTLAVAVGPTGGRLNRYAIASSWTRYTTAPSPLPPADPTCVKFNPAGTVVVVGGGAPSTGTRLQAYTVSGITLAGASYINTADQPGQPVNEIAWSPDGRWLAVAADEGDALGLFVFDTSTTPWTRITPEHDSSLGIAAPQSLVFSPDSADLFVNFSRGSDAIRRYSVAGGAFTLAVKPPQSAGYGKLLIIG